MTTSQIKEVDMMLCVAIKTILIQLGLTRDKTILCMDHSIATFATGTSLTVCLTLLPISSYV